MKIANFNAKNTKMVGSFSPSILKRNWLLCVFCISALNISAQTEPTLTVPPLAIVPEKAAWTVEFQYTGTTAESADNEAYRAAMQRNSEADPVLAKFLKKHPLMADRPTRVKQIETTKERVLRRDIIIRTDGTREERWRWHDWYATKDGHGGINLEAIGGEEEDFPELAWLDKKLFKKTEKINGRECFVFEGQIELSQVDNPRIYRKLGETDADSRIPVTVIVSVVEKLPISIECSGIKRIYKFSPVPPSALVLPPDIAAKIQAAEKRSATRNAPLSPP